MDAISLGLILVVFYMIPETRKAMLAAVKEVKKLITDLQGS